MKLVCVRECVVTRSDLMLCHKLSNVCSSDVCSRGGSLLFYVHIIKFQLIAILQTENKSHAVFLLCLLESQSTRAVFTEQGLEELYAIITKCRS